jgi:hypothetical protein
MEYNIAPPQASTKLQTPGKINRVSARSSLNFEIQNRTIDGDQK